MKFGGGKRGRAKIPSPQLFEPEGFSEPERPLSFLPARASGFVPAARSAAMGQLLSKKVRAKCIITAPERKLQARGSRLASLGDQFRIVFFCYNINTKTVVLFYLEIDFLY
jgi:hypothetical protein